ncbi:polymer-forming cytoskeletal protein [Polaromonas sp.]|uniref:bactofilin family protein n=1 Tax=Polaromonas sp. TaxID=1869339 RepID=UPI00326520D0
MTPHYFTYIAFAVICLTLLTLPFVPAFREWLYPTDAVPLPVSPNYTSDIDHFARRLRADAMAKLGSGPPTGYEEFDFVADTDAGADMDWRQAQKRLIARASISSPDAVRSLQPVYVDGSLRAGADSAFTALYATGDIELGAQSEITDWAHADGVVRLGANSIGLRRISAGVAIELGTEAWFERLHAPVLRFGSHVSSVPQPQSYEQSPASYADLPRAIRQTPELYLIRGDCALPPGKVYTGSLVVTGFLTVGAATTVVGDIKARDGVSIGPRASVRGALTCEKRIYVFPDARVRGPVISESDVLIGANAVIGQSDAQTTVSAANLIVEDGVTVHGTLWAHEIGMVKQL